ncbi:DUF6146 family protein [Pricia sp.]|uniref:DUF6146 family protein n=1 Tax=Pricia sp. TaxID=2268138 RepID=UPI0035948153
MKRAVLQFIVFAILVICAASSCAGTKKAIEVTDDEKMTFNQQEGDTVKIVSDSTEYEIIIIEPGFNIWLASIAKPEGYYSQSYLENRNQIYVINWNQRAMQPLRYGGNLYEMQIDYSPGIDYGYEVNYKLYNYFIYFQRKYNQRIGPWLPRI